jgi:hypothetical protein
MTPEQIEAIRKEWAGVQGEAALKTFAVTHIPTLLSALEAAEKRAGEAETKLSLADRMNRLAVNQLVASGKEKEALISEWIVMEEGVNYCKMCERQYKANGIGHADGCPLQSLTAEQAKTKLFLASAERDTLRARVAELEKTVSLLRSASRGAAKIVDAAMKKDQTNAE